MSTGFKDRLRQIRDASSRRSAIELRLRTDEDLVRSQKTVAAFEFRERVEVVIEEYAQSFQAEAPGFVLTRGFFEGKYMLALRLDEELVDEATTARDRYFSRLQFLLDPHADDGSFRAACKRTIRNRDLETSSRNTEMTDEGLVELSAFIDAQFIDFATHYFERTPLAPPPPVAQG